MTIFAVSVATTVSILNNEHLEHDHDSLLVKGGSTLNEYLQYHSHQQLYQTRMIDDEDNDNDNNNMIIAKVSGEEAQKLIAEMNNGVMIHFRVLNDGDGNEVVELLRDA